MAAILSPLSVHGDNRKMKLPLLHNLSTNPSGANWSCSTSLHRQATPSPQSASSRRKPCDLATCPSTSKLLDAPGSRLCLPSLGFVVQPSNPAGFVVNCRKPRVQTSVVSHYSATAPIEDFVLLFLPPCDPHMTPLATGSLK
jgi:hypothetical protein